MRLFTYKEVFFIIIVSQIIYVFPGCVANYRTSTKPPPRFQKQLDSLKPDIHTKKTTRYTIKKGDTIWKISYDYGVSPDSIVEANNIKDVTDIRPGQQLIIPAGIRSTKDKSIETTLTKKTSESFIWPLNGRRLSDFGQWVDGERSTGIDIHTFNGQGVKASKGGIVALTSDIPDGWGKVIVLQHDDGSYTWYAYNSEILVKKGNKVTRGQIIAKAGSTGRAKQDKLHFKIFLHGVPVNPLYYLP